MDKVDKRCQAQRALSKIQAQRAGKKYVLVKVSDAPLTYKEVEVKD
jgi:hypothetical protein